jgi:hypothetical protein
MLKDASRRKFDIVMSWAIDHLGRSLSDLRCGAPRGGAGPHAPIFSAGTLSGHVESRDDTS